MFLLAISRKLIFLLIKTAKLMIPYNNFYSHLYDEMIRELAIYGDAMSVTASCPIDIYTTFITCIAFVGYRLVYSLG